MGKEVCYIVISLIVAAAIGFTLFHFGKQCSTAALREQHRNGTCKHIHNDKTAKILSSTGGILAAPLVFSVIGYLCYSTCLAANDVSCSGSSSSNRVEPSGSGGAGAAGFVIAMIGFSDD